MTKALKIEKEGGFYEYRLLECSTLHKCAVVHHLQLLNLQSKAVKMKPLPTQMVKQDIVGRGILTPQT